MGKDCVEVAFLDGGHVGVRDSKNPTGTALVFTPGEWGCLHRSCAGRRVQSPASLRTVKSWGKSLHSRRVQCLARSR
ncbi:DUF397 domain-containing protein [Nocardia sp. GCM10030253]|uniref:DUF397 domain-containing protein n=1 Tax=Nocardia sp. GCM10030253 TaxID=3273404 RepID=UPI003633436A